MRNNVKELIARFPGVARPLGDYFNGASFFPDEEEKTLFPVRYAWLTDPWGMHVEAIEREESAVQHAKVILNVLDLDKTISFYKDLLGLQLFRRRSNINSRPRDASMVARLVSL